MEINFYIKNYRNIKIRAITCKFSIKLFTHSLKGLVVGGGEMLVLFVLVVPV